MKLFGRAVMSGVLVAGMALPAVVPAAAQMGYGAPRGGQYASSYYGGNSGYGNGYGDHDRDGWNRGERFNGNDGGYYNRDRGYYRNDSYRGGAYREDGRYYQDRGGIGPGKGAVIGGVAGVVLGGLLGGGKGALIGGAAGAGIGAAAGAANKDSHRYDYGYRRY